MIIFNSNGQQTADLILYPGGIYTREGYQGLSGIAAPTIDGNDTGIRYYNLQGIPVERPVGGLYIRRQVSKAEVIVN